MSLSTSDLSVRDRLVVSGLIWCAKRLPSRDTARTLINVLTIGSAAVAAITSEMERQERPNT